MLVAVLGSSAWASPFVLLFPAVGSPSSVTLSGRVLKHAPSHGSSTLSKNLRWLTTSNWDGAQVEVRYAGRTIDSTSDSGGNFSVTLGSGAKPFEVGFATAEANVAGAETGVATVQILSPQAPFFVVSDFDDTLAVTNVTQTRRMMKAALLQDHTSQPAVEGMAAFYGCLESGQRAQPAFVLVSGSPAQYLHRIKDFLTAHRFPTFGLSLRDLGPRTLSDYKQPVIRSLLTALPNAVVLVGDSGEHDPEVYAQMRAEFPDRVKAIYIRNAGHAEDRSRFAGMVLFDQAQAAAQDAVSKGLASKACVDDAFSEGK
jgi:phosphatidate phosphatase APP1